MRDKTHVDALSVTRHQPSTARESKSLQPLLRESTGARFVLCRTRRRGCRDPFLPQVRCQHLCLREGRVHEERRWRYCSRYSPSDCTRGNWMDYKDHMGRCRNYSKTMSSRKLFVIRKDCVYRRRDLLAFDVDCDSLFFTKSFEDKFWSSQSERREGLGMGRMSSGWKGS
jgi:hypothetical protein